MPEREILIVDDDDAVADSLSLLLEAEGYAVTTFNSAADFLDRWRQERTACLLLDQRMPGMDGMQLLARLGPAAPPTILVTADRDDALVRRALDAGAVAVLTKPIDFDELLQHLRLGEL